MCVCVCVSVCVCVCVLALFILGGHGENGGPMSMICTVQLSKLTGRVGADGNMVSVTEILHKENPDSHLLPQDALTKCHKIFYSVAVMMIG